MSETYTEMLKANFEKMHTDLLIETKLKGGLTEVAEKILEQELLKRNIDTVEINNYVESDVANYKPEDFAEGITLGKLASTGSRYVAQIIDQIIGLCLAFFVAFIWGKTGIKGDFGAAIVFTTYAAYIFFNDAMPNGQSIGKKLLSIKVINKNSGENCSVSESFFRNITTLIPVLAIIDAVMIFGRKKQRMGDKMANTLVINA
jgi:uncharacterized RDD family membrane protein YckC